MEDFWKSEKELIEDFDRGKIPLMTFLRKMEEYRGSMTIDPALGTAVVASFSGHTEGRDLMSILLESSGFRTIRCDRNLPIEKVVEICEEEKATVLCLSVQATWDLENIRKANRMLKEMGIRENIILNAGGGAVSKNVSEYYGCDVFAETAVSTCRAIHEAIDNKG
ncbi:MAG: cobalamin-dependent protein [Candidatus Methanomethylophilus sp.]|nr:cobalamin-dependent protein [Methanomethylophilus sp.]